MYASILIKNWKKTSCTYITNTEDFQLITNVIPRVLVAQKKTFSQQFLIQKRKKCAAMKREKWNVYHFQLRTNTQEANACTHADVRVNKRNLLSLLPTVFASYLGPEPGKFSIMSCRDESSSPGSRRQTSLHCEVFLAPTLSSFQSPRTKQEQTWQMVVIR